MHNSSLVRSFAPGWFASVMGTAVAIIALQVFRSYIPFVDGLLLFFLGNVAHFPLNLAGKGESIMAEIQQDCTCRRRKG
ncbi:MAG: hypothetical protein HY869_11290 [Chloroflexi bacterium]|nr:hypothetical protein [Chloroflexota bacterium]